MEMVPFSLFFIVVEQKALALGGPIGAVAVSRRIAPAWQIRSRRLSVPDIELAQASAYTFSPSERRANPARGTTV
ncbi:hypothetical protein B7R78_0021855 [Ralstonia solanacearum]|uniref:hypothetical protein n=1 Tax=Ralstonia solanacearum species complex TaxID=3116862 RepID=UPI00114093BE|nr:hypothetical protein [Ralstonia solanacearum]MBT1539625.1 hypothetical protein [Ralstonia solanacearum]QOK84172.1 hypothetical protein HF906_18775 [Ralstonia solanacearum]